MSELMKLRYLSKYGKLASLDIINEVHLTPNSLSHSIQKMFPCIIYNFYHSLSPMNIFFIYFTMFIKMLHL